jgi:lipoprotein-anchoring transpeptidase ErfK/SrfK
VFATLVSTGRGRTKGHPSETPKGNHRIWVKLVTNTMDNLENDYASSFYRIEDVPYVQYFTKGVGLHAAFWHRSFGQVRSHGCVNLTPHDAEHLFWWTGPRIPAGWTAALPTAYDRGSLIRVR